MPTLRRIAQRLRHTPGLESLDGLWDLLRGPYTRMIDRGRGTPVKLGGSTWVHMPAEFAQTSWEEFEPETVRQMSDWLRVHPEGVVVDVGSSLGIYSLLSLELSPFTLVIACDSDLPSLGCCERLCARVSAGRLRSVHGFIADQHRSGLTVGDAVMQTRACLSESTSGREKTQYVCLDSPDVDGIPLHSLDGLLLEEQDHLSRPLLVKLDVEGAELHALRGAAGLLRQSRPTLCISVHPPRLPVFGCSTGDVRAMLRDAGYEVEVLAVDHEEHWWCTPCEAIP